MKQRPIDPRRPLSRREIAAFGVGDLGLNFYWQGAGYFLLFFYTDVVGLPNVLAGLIIAAGALVDAVTDPLMGMIADRTRSRYGRYRIYLVAGAPALAVAFAILFIAPLAAPHEAAAIAALGAHIIFRLAYTCVSIPYGSLGVSLSFDARARTSLAGSRMFFGALGGLFVVYLVGALRSGMDDRHAFAAAGAIAGILGALPIVATGLTLEEQTEADGAGERSPTVVRLLRLAASNLPFVILMAAMLSITVANIVFVKSVLYLFERILLAPEAGALAITLMTLTPLAALPFWTIVFRRIDKRPGFLAGSAALTASLFLLFVIGGMSPMGAVVACVLVAASFAAFAVGFWSILPDTIDHGHLRSGVRLESSFIGLASAVQKIGIALAGVAIGVALDSAGYEASGALEADGAELLRAIFALGPLALTALGAAIFLQYPLNAERHRAIVSALSNS